MQTTPKPTQSTPKGWTPAVTFKQRVIGNSEQGWILTVVYDGEQDRSEVWIFDSEHLDEEPVCRLGLPEVIPIGFHGTWKAQ